MKQYTSSKEKADKKTNSTDKLPINDKRQQHTKPSLNNKKTHQNVLRHVKKKTQQTKIPNQKHNNLKSGTIEK